MNKIEQKREIVRRILGCTVLDQYLNSNVGRWCESCIYFIIPDNYDEPRECHLIMDLFGSSAPIRIPDEHCCQFFYDNERRL
jgi:hypothetical protein